MKNYLLMVASLVVPSLGLANDPPAKQERDFSIVSVPAHQIPFSGLASQEAKAQFVLEHSPAFAASPIARMQGKPIAEQRQILDEHYLKPRIKKALDIYPARIEAGEVEGVYVEYIEPKSGVSPNLADKILINLHGGGFTMGARTNGQLESIPVAVSGGFRVVSIDYRQGPEHVFPAASEDVAKVYKSLLKTYAPENIGIFGCSAGGMLAAQSLAWFQEKNLPMPGAVGIFCAGAGIQGEGDSVYLSSAANGKPVPPPGQKLLGGLAYFAGAKPESALVSPSEHPDILARFPPTLLINSTRDFTLSSALYTHRQLKNAGVETELHVWDGLQHFFFKDMELPETHEAVQVIAQFFKSKLGSNVAAGPKTPNSGAARASTK